MSNLTILITGTTRGLGLTLVKHFSRLPTTATIIATGRSPTPSTALKDLISSSSAQIEYVRMDIDDPQSIKEAYTAIADNDKLPDHIDILINNAGIQIYEPNFLEADALTKTLQTNVVAVHNVTSTFLPLLRKGKTKKVINITSTLGSIGMVSTFAMSPTPSYKISKAALNMLNAQYALQYGEEGFTFVVVSPGWLKTDLGKEIADLDVEVGAGAVVKIVESVTKEKDNGAFRNIKVEGWEIYDGSNPPW